MSERRRPTGRQKGVSIAIAVLLWLLFWRATVNVARVAVEVTPPTIPPGHQTQTAAAITATAEASITPSATPTWTPSPTASATPTPTDTPPPTPTSTPTLTPSPGPSPTATASWPPHGRRIYLPALMRSQYDAYGEENDECTSAYPVPYNTTVQFLAEDQHDWYEVTIPVDGSHTMRLDNFVPQAGQLAVYRGETCATAVFLASDGSTSTTKTVALGPQPAGTYFIYVSNDGPLNDTDFYTLRAESE